MQQYIVHLSNFSFIDVASQAQIALPIWSFSLHGSSNTMARLQGRMTAFSSAG
jgi:hypothetical protein